MDLTFRCSHCTDDASAELRRLLTAMSTAVADLEDFEPFDFVCDGCKSRWDEVELMRWVHAHPPLRPTLWGYCLAACTTHDSAESSKASHCLPADDSWDDTDFENYAAMVAKMRSRLSEMPEDAFALMHRVDAWADDQPRRAGRLIGLCLTSALPDHEPLPDIVFVVEEPNAWAGLVEGDVSAIREAVTGLEEPADEDEAAARRALLERLA